MMTKFKVGDKVKKVNGKNFGDGEKVNTILEYKSAHWDSKIVPWVHQGWLSESDLELVEEDKSWPQVGDKGIWQGSVYTLVNDGKRSSWPYWKGKDDCSWNPFTTKGYKPYYEEETEKGEDNMTENSNQFVETTKVIKEVINTLDSGGAKMSVEPTGKANVRLTIGAEYRHGGANCFNKRTLQDLIHNLQEVCDLLEP